MSARGRVAQESTESVGLRRRQKGNLAPEGHLVSFLPTGILTPRLMISAPLILVLTQVDQMHEDAAKGNGTWNM